MTMTLAAAILTAGAAPESTPRAETGLEKLDFLAGHWNIQEKILSDQLGTVGSGTSGEADFGWVLGHRFMRQDFTGREAGEVFQGVGLLTHDAELGKYRAWWFDSFGGTVEMRGEWAGSDLVLTGEERLAGQEIRTRWTYHPIRPAAFVLTFEQAQGAAGFSRLFEIEYTKDPKPVGAGSKAGASRESPGTGSASQAAADLEKLRPFTGRWRLRASPSGGASGQGAEREGTSDSAWRLEGRFVVSREHLRAAAGDVEALGFLTYDEGKKSYRSWWFDSTGKKQEFTGRWDGGSLVLSPAPGSAGSGPVANRVYSEVRPASYRVAFEGGAWGGETTRGVVVVYTRAE